ncbi:MAG TPA: class I SAM-dependent methyltransferase [Candidatus Limnocylindria bacterium]|nr:class I SAM-dependent methyltransferase [Candidatus Limnocylindria bacterium]
MATRPSATGNGERESFISCRNSQGAEIRATPVRLTRFTTVFEVYNPYSLLQLSEVLGDFRITINDRLVYSGRAVVTSIVNTGIMLLCEVTLDEAWLDVDLFSPISHPDRLRAEFEEFMLEWRKIQAVTPEFKIAVADFQTLLVDLRRWLDQVELAVRAEPLGGRADKERTVLRSLEGRILPEIAGWMDRFDEVADQIAADVRPAHRVYARRQLHPLVLCSPFVYRTYQKPLGYAGDFEMVNMILRDPREGGTLFAKLINVVFLQNPPAEAHRHRIQHLMRRLAEESRRVMNRGRRLRVLNLGCGPAREIQEFMADDPAADNVDFLLMDFNPQTLEYTRQKLQEVKTANARRTGLVLVEKSVNQLLKEAIRLDSKGQVYDFVYCAGLFDYVSDRICKRLTDMFYSMLAPEGLLLVTNVDASKPFRHSMDYLLDWHLIYRSRAQMEALIPGTAKPGYSTVLADPTAVNLFLEVRRPPAS